MTNVVWLAAHAATPFEPERLRTWADAIEATLAARLAPLTRVEAWSRHTALVAWVDERQIPRTWRQTQSAGGRLAITDGFPIGFERAGLTDAAPLAIADALVRDRRAIEVFLPPFASVAADHGRVRIATDTLGFAKVYRATSGDVTAWSGSPMVLSSFAYGEARLSAAGWISLLAREAFIDDLTPLAGITLESPGASIAMADRPDGLRVERPDPERGLFRPPDEPVAPAVRRALVDTLRSIQVLDPGPLTVPLSGGRDSRLLAALALEMDLATGFWTSSPPELDLEIAQQLILRLDRAIPWSMRDKIAEARQRDDRATTAARTTSHIWDALIQAQAVTEGEGDITPQTTQPRASAPIDGPSLWGIGGEFGRAFYYRAGDIERADDAVEAFWAGRRSGGRLVDPVAAHDLLVPRVEAIRRSMSAAGIEGLAQLDHWYVFQRVRRLQNRVGTTSGIRPYFGLAYLRATLGRSPGERATTTFHEALVAEAYPRWRGVPYAHQLSRTRPDVASAQSHAEAFWVSPFVAELHAEVIAALRDHPYVHRGEAARLLVLGGRRDGRSTARMRDFGRLLDLLSFERFVTTANTTFRAADGLAVSTSAGPVPVSTGVRSRTVVDQAQIRAVAKVRCWRATLRPTRLQVERLRRFFRS